MNGGQIEAPARGQAQPGQGGRYAEAAGTRNIAQPTESAKRTRPRGFAAWNPRPASLELVQDVQSVLDDYRAHLPLTIRQIFYRLVASRGFDSLTAKHDLAHELAMAMDMGQPAEILHIGDLDPSGEHLFTSLAEDVSAMTEALFGAAPRFTRLAVTREQADRLGLPTAPPKATDRRRFDGDTVQCEAIDPATLSGILRDAIEARRNPDTAARLLDRESDMRADLVARLGGAI